jgi:hypothetical protein
VAHARRDAVVDASALAASHEELRAKGGRWQRHCASTPRLRRSTLAGMVWERAEGGRWKRHCASTPQRGSNTLLLVCI